MLSKVSPSIPGAPLFALTRRRHGSGCPSCRPCHREDRNGTLSPAWPSGIVSSEVPGSFLEFSALCAISFPLLLQKHDKSIAPSLSQGYVVLEIQSVHMGKSDSLADPVKFRFLISTGCLPARHRQGSPVFILVWLPLRVTPVTPEVHLSVMVVIVRIDAAVFPFVGQGRQLHFAVSRLHLGSRSLRPAGLLSSLKEPLSGNLVLQVTLHTSLKLHG